MLLTRRNLMLSGAGLAAASMIHRPAFAADTLNVAAVAVHKTVATEGAGGDTTQAWQARTGWGVEWATFTSPALYDRLMREVSLTQTDVDASFLLNTQAIPSITELFEPLDELMAAAPPEDIDDVFGGMREAMTIDGKLYGMPYRHAIGGLHYNEELLAERGLSGPPQTIEELVEYAKQLTYTRADGTEVTGFILVGYPSIVAMARAWDGDYITQDYRVVANEPPMVRAIAALREMYEAGAFPKTFATMNKEDQNTWMQTGRAAMCISPMGRYSLFNDPERSQFAGRISTTSVPISEELRDRYDVAPTNLEFWSLVIPRHSSNKAQAWDFIREITNKENTLKAALNGNGPVRNSTYEQESFAGTLPYVAAEQQALRVARVPMPAFDGSARADDLFIEAFEAALLGMQTPQEAMDNLVAEVEPLMPGSAG